MLPGLSFDESKSIMHHATFPESLNDKLLPATRIFQLLGEWLPLVREAHIFCHRAVEPCMLNLLSRFPNVQRCRLDAERSDESTDSLKHQLIEQPALREWFLFNTIPGSWPLLPSFQSLQTLEIESLSSGILVVPAMPALLGLQIHFDFGFYCEKDA
ncbi:hypothetical protein BBP40_008230 [Aspergillus hancockii]|nr:hypothetical protein BBP40_008230 [Aspergillus hancockii]